MEPSRADRKRVYCSPCRAIFTQFDNARLRKQKPIRQLVQQNKLAVSTFANERLVQILQSLLRDRIFESTSVARAAFPEIFKPVPTSTASTTFFREQVDPKSADPVTMALQNTMQRELMTSLGE